MNKIVRDHYPAANLPEDLREGLAKDATVRVVIEESAPNAHADEFEYPVFARLYPPSPSPMTVEGTLERIRQYRSANSRRITIDNAVQEIRAIRDEWE